MSSKRAKRFSVKTSHKKTDFFHAKKYRKKTRQIAIAFNYAALDQNNLTNFLYRNFSN